MKRENKQRQYYKTSALLFILFLVLFVGANIIVKDKTFSETENRMLAGKPKFSVDKLLEGRFT
ncbi:hypothetical protein GNF68_17155, partial [Clostridium perfringens]|nr:hypothetical protein [Clostridium perfringens]